MSNNPRSPLTLAALATVAIPGLDVIATRPPAQEGADFDAASLLDSQQRRWTIRAPVSAAAGAAMEAEVEVLTTLSVAVDDGRLPFDVPRPQGFAPLPEGGRAMVYPELPGQALDVDSLHEGSERARRVGRAIAELHELDTSIVADAGLPVYDAQSYRTRRLAELDETARSGYVPAALLRRWEQALEDVRLWRFRPTVVHGDLAAEHILIDQGQVSAFLDWADARVADPADDLSWLLAAASPEAGEAILSAYGQARTGTMDRFLADRALLASELALARWLMHGVRHHDQVIIDDAVQMLHDLKEAVAGAPAIGAEEPPVVSAAADDSAPVTGVEGESVPAAGRQPLEAHFAMAAEARTGHGGDAGADLADADLADEEARAGLADEPERQSDPEQADTPDLSGEIATAGATPWGDDAITAPFPAPQEDPGHDPGADGGADQVAEPDLLEPDYHRRSGRRGVDDSPTSQLPATET